MTTVKKNALIATVALMVIAACLTLVGCGSNDSKGSSSNDSSINVTSREDGSGTRGAFIELFGIEEKDSSGAKVDKTTTSAAITNSTAVMMTTVANDKDAIGYISLGSVNDTVKAVKIDGAEASADAVKNGSYKVSRPFNVVTKGELSAVAQDFLDFIMSTDGQKVVSDNGYIEVENGGAYTSKGLTGKVTPVMEKLAEAYKALNPNVIIEVNQSDSTTGVTSAIEGACDLGMASRELKDSETSQGVTAKVIATDGIAVIVNNDNKVDNLTSDQVKKIFTGEVTKWSEIG